MEKRNAGFAVSVKRLSDSERVLRFVGTTDIKDRTGEILEADSWKLKNYKKNPVFLLAHDYRSLPIGKTVNIEQGKKGLMFDVEFADKDTYPLADTVFKLYEGGFMNGVSVGYKPNMDKVDVIDGVPHFKDNELYELSAASVPANPEALMERIFEAEQKGIVNRQEVLELTLAAKSFFSAMKNTKPEPEVTEKYIRIRVRQPGLFIDATFRTIDISKKDGIKAVAGKLKADGRGGSMIIQSYLFDKEKWTIARAEAWVKEHGKAIEGIIADQDPRTWDKASQFVPEEKVGRVLSKANEKLIRDAVQSITKVLDKVSIQEPEEPKTVKYPSFKGIYNSLLSKKAVPKSGNVELIDTTLIEGVKGLNKKEN